VAAIRTEPQRAPCSVRKGGAVALTIVSSVAGGALLVLLVRNADLTAGRVLDRINGLHPAALVLLVAAMSGIVWCSAEKWRLVVARTVCQGAAPILPPGTYFASTALGMLAGHMLPPFVGAAAARGAAMKLLRRGTIVQTAGTTAFEQMFDGMPASFCAGATLISIVLHVSREGWMLATAMGWCVAAVPTVFAARRIARGVAWPGLSQPALIRRLMLLSLCRYAALIASAYATASAADLPVSLWQVAAVVPLAMLSVLVSFAPAGLGVNEWTFASALTALGVPFATAAEFALLNRVLNVLGVVAAVAVGLGVLLAGAIRRRRAPGQDQRSDRPRVQPQC
jgi:glycosyltransferase 2 family protein